MPAGRSMLGWFWRTLSAAAPGVDVLKTSKNARIVAQCCTGGCRLQAVTKSPAKSVQRALKKGGPKVVPDQMNMIIAMSLTIQGKTAEATAAFNSVSGSTAALARAKHLWLLYLNRKTATASAAPAAAQ